MVVVIADSNVSVRTDTLRNYPLCESSEECVHSSVLICWHCSVLIPTGNVVQFGSQRKRSKAYLQNSSVVLENRCLSLSFPFPGIGSQATTPV